MWGIFIYMDITSFGVVVLLSEYDYNGSVENL